MHFFACTIINNWIEWVTRVHAVTFAMDGIKDLGGRKSFVFSILFTTTFNARSRGEVRSKSAANTRARLLALSMRFLMFNVFVTPEEVVHWLSEDIKDRIIYQHRDKKQASCRQCQDAKYWVHPNTTFGVYYKHPKEINQHKCTVAWATFWSFRIVSWCNDRLYQNRDYDHRVHQMIQPPWEKRIECFWEYQFTVYGVQRPENCRDKHRGWESKDRMNGIFQSTYKRGFLGTDGIRTEAIV